MKSSRSIVICEKNINFVRYQFFSYAQEEGQPFDQFVTALKKCAANCEFGELRDSLIRDRIVCGTIDSKLQERYLRENELSLERAIQLGRAVEKTRKYACELRSSKPQPVDAVESTQQTQRHPAREADFFQNSVDGDTGVEIVLPIINDVTFVENCTISHGTVHRKKKSSKKVKATPSTTRHIVRKLRNACSDSVTSDEQDFCW